MTIKEIADKYQLPYHLVYESTVGVDYTRDGWSNKDFPEQEVIHNVKAILRQRIEKRQQYVDEGTRMLNYIKWKSGR